MKCDEKHEEKNQDITMQKKIWGRMQAAAYMFMNRHHQCPVQGCVCVYRCANK